VQVYGWIQFQVSTKLIGPYIADFYCAAKKLIIELDGGGHAGEHQAFSLWRETGFHIIR
jgi:very-short-patch-repair endonuclease